MFSHHVANLGFFARGHVLISKLQSPFCAKCVTAQQDAYSCDEIPAWHCEHAIGVGG